MKCCLLTEVFPPMTGGSGRWLYEVYKRLPRTAVSVCAGEHPDTTEFDRLQQFDITRLPLTFPHWGILDRQGFSQYLAMFRRLRRHIRQKEISVLHCGRLIPEGWIAWMIHCWSRLPYWIYVHGEELSYGHHSRQLNWMMRRVLSRATGVIANSQNTAKLLKEDWQVAANKLHIVNPGVDADEFTPTQFEADVRSEFGWSGKKVVLTVGRLQKRKGHDTLIRALPAIRQAVPNILYSIVGHGEERASLDALARELGVHDVTQFLGEVKDKTLIRCFQQCDVFALPNREVNGDIEGFGMVLVEAQACGKPVLAGRSGGTGETMDEPKTGVRVACESPEPLSEALVCLLTDELRCARMGAAARLWVEEKFSWPVLTKKLQTILGLDTI